MIGFLKGKQGFVSGQEIADALSISRTAVWKSIKKAKTKGYVIETRTGSGYKLHSDDYAYGEFTIIHNLCTRWLGRNDKVIFLDNIDSTNEEAKRRASVILNKSGSKGESGDGLNPVDEPSFSAMREGINGLLIVADEQDSGKGRRGRKWELSSGTGIAMSYLLTPNFKPDAAPMMTLIMALACVTGIRKATGLPVSIKWPNDIVLNGKKIVGILTEMSVENEYISYVVIGTGINVNAESFPEELKAKASSLKLEAGREFSRTEILCRITEDFEERYEKFIKRGNLEDFCSEYNDLCVNNGTRVMVHDPKGEFEAYSKGIDERGELIVEMDDGTIRKIYAGEVSVRGIYGYV